MSVFFDLLRGKHDLHKVATVSGDFDVGVVGIAEHDAGYDEEDSRGEELHDPEGNEEALAPDLLRGDCFGVHCCFDSDSIGSKQVVVVVSVIEKVETLLLSR